MANKGKKSRGIGAFAALVLVLFVTATAVAFYVASGSVKAVKPPGEHKLKIKPPTVVQVGERRKVVVFLPRESRQRVYLAPVTVKTEAKGSLLDVALEALIDAGTEGGQAAGLIPEGTKVLEPVKVRNGTATVSFSQSIQDNFNGGSDQEALTLNSIAHTLVSNSGGQVSKVQILVEGKTVESLGGHFELTDPIEADSTLLKPGGSD